MNEAEVIRRVLYCAMNGYDCFDEDGKLAVIPVTYWEATEIFRMNHALYCIYEDNTEDLVKNANDIAWRGGWDECCAFGYAIDNDGSMFPVFDIEKSWDFRNEMLSQINLYLTYGDVIDIMSIVDTNIHNAK